MKCQDKNAYDKKSAQTAVNDMHRRGMVNIRTYQCPTCDMWHLTHKRQNDKNKRR